ncbi:MAG: JAB domain-containing protein [Bacteroidota bacterium]
MTRRTKYEYKIAARVRTIVWKFRDVEESYPELGDTKDSKICSPWDMYRTFKFLFDHEVREKFVVFWLSAANKVIGFEVITEGTLSSTIVEPREVFRGAIVASCKSIIVAHNHPSGNKEPSKEDLAITEKLKAAGKIIGIEVLDHIIFTNHDFYSCSNAGFLK